MTELQVAAHIAGWTVSILLTVAFVATLVLIWRKDFPRD